MVENSAYQALIRLAGLSRSAAHGLPAQEDVIARWSGIGFTLMGKRFVAPMGQVSELMEVPSSTRLPGVQPWVIGLSNVRGRLLPLFDLCQFFGGNMNNQRKNHRVLVLETDSLYSGIVVDRAFGMQHFLADSFSEESYGLPQALSHYINGAYEDGEREKWSVFHFSQLADDPRFISAAAV